MPIYGKNPSKIFFSVTGRPFSTKLGMKHLSLKYYNVYINHDPAMTFTYFTTRPSFETLAFTWEKVTSIYSLKTIAAGDLKSGRCQQLMDKLKVYD